jgi:hypothetical protein
LAAKYIVGIDLGTTNSALARCDAITEEDSHIEVLSIPQLVNPGEVAERTLLPSFLYIPGEFDFPRGSTALPWDPEPKLVIGELARKRGAESPNRLIASAKSWLSYAGVNRTAPILPWQAPDEVPKLSPVEASSQFLQHLRTVWDSGQAAGQPEPALAEQDVLLTVPASFDEEARELTRRAAEQAGLQNVTLLEEPQAAFYAWLESQGDAWRSRIKVGDLVLVCDVGGGTTDFSLITVSEENGELTLKRVAVGDHILLGGDNMDLALARLLQQRLEASGHRVDTWQLHGLWHQCRMAKEKLFASPRTQSAPITLLGKGTKLIGGTIKTELAREDLDQVLVKGFFPEVASSELPARQRRVGFQELGLPYAADAAITKHLARFLSEQIRNSPEEAAIRRGRSGLACPTHILFNGGVMKAAVLRDRVIQALNSWLKEEGFDGLGAQQMLDAPDLEHAVLLTTVRRDADAAYAFAVAPRAPITSELKARCLRCREWKLRSRRSASFRLAWRRVPRPRFPAGSLASSSASRPSFVSSLPAFASRTTSAACWKIGVTISTNSAHWKSRLHWMGSRDPSYRCGSRRASLKSARSRSGAYPVTPSSAGSLS